MTQHFDWIVVSETDGRQIGMIGFLKHEVVAIASFFDGRDTDMDGRVDIGERVVSAFSPSTFDTKAIEHVATEALGDPQIASRVPNLAELAANVPTQFTSDMVIDAVWASYFIGGVEAKGRGGVTEIVKSDRIKRLVIRKEFEQAAKDAFDRGV